MKKYSVWYLPYNKKYLLTHPWKWIKCIYRNFRDAWRRSVYGWTWSDCWNLNTWMVRTIPDMLRHIADYGDAYPGREPFETPEKWHEWLHHVADLLETGDEEWQDEHNEFARDYFDHWKDKERFQKYWAKSKQLQEQGETNIKEAFHEIGEFFFDLWD